MNFITRPTTAMFRSMRVGDTLMFLVDKDRPNKMAINASALHCRVPGTFKHKTKLLIDLETHLVDKVLFIMRTA